MYYSSGNYEAFARPEKPKDVDSKSAYIIGTGLAGLSAAFFLVRDGQMKGENIHLLEKLPISGGSCDGFLDVSKGYFMRGGREMDNHFECMWDMYKDVPSIETQGISVLDEYYWLNKHDPNYSLCRATINCGEDAHTDGLFNLDKESAQDLMRLFMISEDKLEDVKICDFMNEKFWDTNFWLYWQTMFAFQKWSSALEMKRYIQRYVHHIDGLPDFSALRFTKYNQYESMILPLLKYLESHGVTISYDVKVTNVIIDQNNVFRVASSIEYEDSEGNEHFIPLTENDLVFITNGCCTDVSCYGTQNTIPDLTQISPGHGDSWDLWKNIAIQGDDFGHPEVFCEHVDETNWMSATIETKDKEIIECIEHITHRNPLSGKVTTGGIVTVKDSVNNWYLSWTVNRQPQFKHQPKDTVLIWVYGLSTDVPGNYIRKPMRDCTGCEIAQEWLYHIGLDMDKIEDYAQTRCNTTTCYMPYITAFFQPRKKEDRPLVVPKNAKNFAFIGQFAETPRDTIFTTEYSIRTGMEAVYTLLDIDRGVPEVWGSMYDVRELFKACYYALDKKSLNELPLNFKDKIVLKKIEERIKNSDIENLLEESHLIDKK